MADIFVSYGNWVRDSRRVGARQAFDGVIHQLYRQFGRADVFVHSGSIPMGTVYQEAMRRRVADSDVVLVLIDHEWTAHVQGTRVSEGADPVGVVDEVATALHADAVVIPVLLDGVRMPRADELPDSLRALASRQHVRVDPDTLDRDIARLASTLDLHVPATAEFEPAETHGPLRRWHRIAAAAVLGACTPVLLTFLVPPGSADRARWAAESAAVALIGLVGLVLVVLMLFLVRVPVFGIKFETARRGWRGPAPRALPLARPDVRPAEVVAAIGRLDRGGKVAEASRVPPDRHDDRDVAGIRLALSYLRFRAHLPRRRWVPVGAPGVLFPATALLAAVVGALVLVLVLADHALPWAYPARLVGVVCGAVVVWLATVELAYRRDRWMLLATIRACEANLVTIEAEVTASGQSGSGAFEAVSLRVNSALLRLLTGEAVDAPPQDPGVDGRRTKGERDGSASDRA